MSLHRTLGLIALTCIWVAGDARAVTLTVRNPSDQNWIEAPVVVPFTPAMAGVSKGELAIQATSDATLAVQRDDLDGDGRTDELAFLVSLKPGESRDYTLIPRPADMQVPQRAHARMSLKGYDGVGWESDVRAFRIYWNADNATDLFGKTHPILSLDGWATPGVSHQIENQYGVDVLKVGRAFGIDGFAAFINGKVEKISNVMKTYYIRSDGPIRAVVDLEYVFWQPGPFPDLSRQAITSKSAPKYDLIVRMSIFAGQRWAEADVRIVPHSGSAMPEMVTGFPKQREETELIQDKTAGILGRWGRQALGDREVPKAGNLGMGVIVNPAKTIDFGEDDFNSYVRLKPEDGRIRYRYHASWFKEPGAAKATHDYEMMLRYVAKLRPEVTVK